MLTVALGLNVHVEEGAKKEPDEPALFVPLLANNNNQILGDRESEREIQTNIKGKIERRQRERERDRQTDRQNPPCKSVFLVQRLHYFCPAERETRSDVSLERPDAFNSHDVQWLQQQDLSVRMFCLVRPLIPLLFSSS